MNKKFLKGLKKSIDKSINNLEDNSKDIEYVLEKLGKVNMDEISQEDRDEIDRLLEHIKEVDEIIEKIVGGEE